MVSGSGLVFSFMEHRLSYEDSYTISVDLTPLVALLAATCFIILARSKILLSVLPLSGFLLYPYLGFSLALGTSSIFLVILGCYKMKLWSEFFSILLASLSVVYLSSIVYWLIFYPFGLPYPLIGLASQEFYLYYVTAPLSVICIAAIVIVSIYKPFNSFRRRGEEETQVHVSPTDRKTIVYLLLVVGLGIFAAIYPNLPGVNPNSINIGTDVMHYVPFLDQVNLDISKINEVYYGSRPLFFLVLLSFEKALGLSSYWAVSLIPVLIIPALALSMFFLVKEATSDSECALWASFFTVAGFHTVVGLYGFLLADMFSLALAFTMLTMFFKWSKSFDWRYLMGSVLFGVSLLFSHPWTFDQYVAVLPLVVIPIIFRKNSKKEKLFVIALMIIAAIGFGAAEILQNDVFGGVGGLEALGFLSKTATTANFFSGIAYSIFYFSGTMANVVLLVLLVVGLLRHRIGGTAGLYLTLFPLVTTLAFLIFTVDMKSRILFNIPFGLYAAIGMIEYRKIKDMNLRTIFPVFIVLLLLAYQLRSLANLI